jgi:hypothetical protein
VQHEEDDARHDHLDYLEDVVERERHANADLELVAHCEVELVDGVQADVFKRLKVDETFEPKQHLDRVLEVMVESEKVAR